MNLSDLVDLLTSYSFLAGGAALMLSLLLSPVMRIAGTDVNDEQTQNAASLGVRLHSSLVGAGFFLFSTSIALFGSSFYFLDISTMRAVMNGLLPSAAAVAFGIVTIALVRRGPKACDCGFAAKCWQWGLRFLVLSILIMLGGAALRAINQ